MRNSCWRRVRISVRVRSSSCCPVLKIQSSWLKALLRSAAGGGPSSGFYPYFFVARPERHFEYNTEAGEVPSFAFITLNSRSRPIATESDKSYILAALRSEHMPGILIFTKPLVQRGTNSSYHPVRVLFSSSFPDLSTTAHIRKDRINSHCNRNKLDSLSYGNWWNSSRRRCRSYLTLRQLSLDSYGTQHISRHWWHSKASAPLYRSASLVRDGHVWSR